MTPLGKKEQKEAGMRNNNGSLFQNDLGGNVMRMAH